MKKAVVYILAVALSVAALTACGAYGMQNSPRTSAMPAVTPQPTEDTMMPDIEDGIVTDEDGILVEEDGVVTEKKTETERKVETESPYTATVKPSASADAGAVGKANGK